MYILCIVYYAFCIYIKFSHSSDPEKIKWNHKQIKIIKGTLQFQIFKILFITNNMPEFHYVSQLLIMKEHIH